MKTLALGGLGLAAGVNNFDPYNILPVVSIASLAGTIALVRFAPAQPQNPPEPEQQPTGSNWVDQYCITNLNTGSHESLPMCQAFSALNNTHGTSNNLLPWNKKFATVVSTDQIDIDGIQPGDMQKSVMWGTDPLGRPFIAMQYTSDKTQGCAASFFLPYLNSTEIMKARVEPLHCPLGPLLPQKMDPRLFGPAFKAFLQGNPLQIENQSILQLGLPPEPEEPAAGGASDPVQEEQQLGQKEGGVQDSVSSQQPGSQAAGGASDPVQEKQEPGPQAAGGASDPVQEKQEPGPQATGGASDPVQEEQEPGSQAAGGASDPVQKEQQPKPASGEQAAGGSAICVPSQPQSTRQPTKTGGRGQGTSLLIRDGLQLDSSAFTNKA
jgi:hypothetical protein